MEALRRTVRLDSSDLTGTFSQPYPWGMEVHFTAEQEAHLARVASHAGTNPEGLLKDAALRLLEEDARFRAGVQRGIEEADRGDFIEEDEMDARIARMLES